jgi:hypothetical protein
MNCRGADQTELRSSAPSNRCHQVIESVPSNILFGIPAASVLPVSRGCHYLLLQYCDPRQSASTVQDTRFATRRTRFVIANCRRSGRAQAGNWPFWVDGQQTGNNPGLGPLNADLNCDAVPKSGSRELPYSNVMGLCGAQRVGLQTTARSRQRFSA